MREVLGTMTVMRSYTLGRKLSGRRWLLAKLRGYVVGASLGWWTSEGSSDMIVACFGLFRR